MNHHSHSMNETLHEIEFFHQQIEKLNLIWLKYKEEFIISQDINWLQMWMNQRTRLMSEACLFHLVGRPASVLVPLSRTVFPWVQ